MIAGVIAAGWGERLQGSGEPATNQAGERPTRGARIPKPLVKVSGKPLIDWTLENLKDAGADRAVIIINEASTAVRDHVNQRGETLPIEWIVKTTPSSMHSFLEVSSRFQEPGLISTVDTIAPTGAYRAFAEKARAFRDADLVLAVTSFIDDEKPLRVFLDETGRVHRLGECSSCGEFVTSGFYWVTPALRSLHAEALRKNLSALRQFLGMVIESGKTVYAAPVSKTLDVDRPRDIQTAEEHLKNR